MPGFRNSHDELLRFGEDLLATLHTQIRLLIRNDPHERPSPMKMSSRSGNRGYIITAKLQTRTAISMMFDRLHDKLRLTNAGIPEFA
ncbi:MAG TPA: hypothetical protein PLM56_14435 [Cyclobacteriaceae bacterium]|jgi:hypothetical protein|nr:hypothetical protein [Cyclobacteriaceae bacterium]HRF34700.1 hypothetical protein [Cyclobacteriaceae bacterium]